MGSKRRTASPSLEERSHRWTVADVLALGQLLRASGFELFHSTEGELTIRTGMFRRKDGSYGRTPEPRKTTQ